MQSKDLFAVINRKKFERQIYNISRDFRANTLFIPIFGKVNTLFYD